MSLESGLNVDLVHTFSSALLQISGYFQVGIHGIPRWGKTQVTISAAEPKRKKLHWEKTSLFTLESRIQGDMWITAFQYLEGL